MHPLALGHLGNTACQSGPHVLEQWPSGNLFNTLVKVCVAIPLACPISPQRKVKSVPQWKRKTHIIESINELIEELENIQQSITIQGVEHIHAKEVGSFVQASVNCGVNHSCQGGGRIGQGELWCESWRVCISMVNDLGGSH